MATPESDKKEIIKEIEIAEIKGNINTLKAEIDTLRYKISVLNVQQTIDKGNINALRAEIEELMKRTSILELQQIANDDNLYERIAYFVREHYQDDIDRLLTELRAEFRSKLKEKYNLK